MLARLLAPRSEAAFTLLRVVAGAMFAFHGVQKLFGVLAGTVPAPFTQVWLGGVIELVGGTAITLGVFTRYAAFIASGTMAVAYLQFHWKGAFDSRFFPAVNKGELALLYSVVFLYVACRGAGRWSIDGQQSRG